MLADGLIARDRVTHTIQDLLSTGNVLTVYAPSGAGKTTAVALALAEIGRPTAWLSLDGTESAAGRLLIYLEAAVVPYAPDAQGAATDALATGIPVGEAAGLLAESLHGTGLVVVCDNAERIAASESAVAALSALARYIPPDVTVVFISRTALPLDPGPTSELGRVVELTGFDLAFNLEETKEALRLTGRPVSETEETFRMTGGWVAGVLFSGGSAHAGTRSTLREYLTTQVLSGLSEDECRFLLFTSLLDEVTVESATALGLHEAPRIMATLRQRHLPVTWTPDAALVVSPQLRDHLLELLAQYDAEKVRKLRHRHAGLLLDRGEREEAVHVLLSVGAVDEAWSQAAGVLPELIERMDFEPAARWLDALRASSHPPEPSTAAIILRVAFALEQTGRATELLDRHGWDWVEELASADTPNSAEALVLLTWCLWHAGRIEDAGRAVGMLPPGRPHDIALTVLALSHDGRPPEFPQFATTPSGPLDGLLMRLAFVRGRLTGLDDPGLHGPWRSVMGAPWVIATLRATGRIEQAMKIYEAHRDQRGPLWLHALDATELMLDLGRGHDAWRALQHGRDLAPKTGSQLYAVLISVMEAKLFLRLHNDPESALRALDQADVYVASRYGYTREQALMWRGLALLKQDRPEAAREMLAESIRSMRQSDRLLELPTAACYLAEVQWRLGDETGSDRSAALALAVAEQFDTMHLLLTALADVPAVAVRGADNEPGRTSRWHELTARLTEGRRIVVSGRTPRLVLEEFGTPELTIDGVSAMPRLRKSIELLAFLLASPDRTVGRRFLLNALFDSRNEAAARSYLRQALYRLREVLPDDVAPIVDGDQFRLAGPDVLVSSSEEVLAAFAQADHQSDENRLHTLSQALSRVERGPYLSGLTSNWVEARRTDIDQRTLQARLDLARAAFRLGRYLEASTNVETVLRHDPYREQAWLLRLSLAQASGNDDHVLTLYRRYLGRMRELAVPPSAEIQRLVSRLRG